MSQEYKIKKCVCVRLVYLKEKERKTRTRFVKTRCLLTQQEEEEDCFWLFFFIYI